MKLDWAEKKAEERVALRVSASAKPGSPVTQSVWDTVTTHPRPQ